MAFGLMMKMKTSKVDKSTRYPRVKKPPICWFWIAYPIPKFDTKPRPPKFGFTWWPKNVTDAFVSCWIAAGTTSLPAPHEVQSSPNQLTISTIRIRENHQKVGHSLNTWPARSAEGYPDRITIPFWVPIEEILHHWSMSLLYNCIYGTVHSCHELHANQRITIWDTQWISMVSTSVYQIQWVVRFCSVFKMFYLFSSRCSRSAMFGTYAQGTWTWYLFQIYACVHSILMTVSSCANCILRLKFCRRIFAESVWQ